MRDLCEKSLVLVVDDDEAVRDLAKSCLERHNFAVLTAANGLEGLQIYQQNRDRICVVVTGIHMPVMNGAKMIRRLVNINPAVKVIIASSELVSYAQANVGSATFLAKPFTPQQLINTVRSLL